MTKLIWTPLLFWVMLTFPNLAHPIENKGLPLYEKGSSILQQVEITKDDLNSSSIITALETAVTLNTEVKYLIRFGRLDKIQNIQNRFNRAPESYMTYSLAKPNRFVLDCYGTLALFEKKVPILKDSGILKITLANKSSGGEGLLTRITFFLNSDVKIEPQLLEGQTEFSLIFKKIPTEVEVLKTAEKTWYKELFTSLPKFFDWDI
jgi:hypothetical protein